MAAPTSTLEQFQAYIWQNLPMRKHMVGKEPIYDLVAVAVQEWPDEILSNTKSGDAGEEVALSELSKTIQRHMTLVYGQAQFGSLWIVALQVLLPVVIDLILRWWRRRKQNQGRLRIWRRRWVNGD